MVRLALVPVLFVGVVGCEANGGDEGLFVTKNVAPTGTTCTFTADEAEPFFSHGAITTQLGPTAYLINPQIKSRITALDTEVDQKTVITTGADVDVSFADSTVGSGIDSSLLHFREVFSAPIAPNDGITDAGFILLPEALVTAIGTAGGTGPFEIEVITAFTIRGNMSGQDVSSQQFTYAVTVGNDLVTNVIPSTLDMNGNCHANTGVTIRNGNPCNITQDEIVDCCTNMDGSLACPASL
jgi:hypothetical protein